MTASEQAALVVALAEAQRELKQAHLTANHLLELLRENDLARAHWVQIERQQLRVIRTQQVVLHHLLLRAGGLAARLHELLHDHA